MLKLILMPTPHAVINPINYLLSGSYVMALLSYLKLNFGRLNIISYIAYLAGSTIVRPFWLLNVWIWTFILAENGKKSKSEWWSFRMYRQCLKINGPSAVLYALKCVWCLKWMSGWNSLKVSCLWKTFITLFWELCFGHCGHWCRHMFDTRTHMHINTPI